MALLLIVVPMFIRNTPFNGRLGGVNGFESEAILAEETEIISVVRIGVSLVEYIYKVFSKIARDSGAADEIQR